MSSYKKIFVELHRDSGIFLQSFGYYLEGLFNETPLKFLEELIQSKPEFFLPLAGLHASHHRWEKIVTTRRILWGL